MKTNSNKIFITAIDTDAGKTVVTGALARQLLNRGAKAITQKIVQTGVYAEADDILVHRAMMGIPLLDVDSRHITCPYCFETPASPALAARLESKFIDKELIMRSANLLADDYDFVLMEGAGGLYVPLSSDYFIIDFIVDNNLPVVLVASAKLGSINHTLLSIDALLRRNIDVIAVVFNEINQTNIDITDDSFRTINKYLLANVSGADCIRFPYLTDFTVGDYGFLNPLVDKIFENRMFKPSLNTRPASK